MAANLQRLSKFKLCTLDVTNTLMRLRSPVGESYKAMLLERCTSAHLRGQVLSLAPSDVARSFLSAYSTHAKAVPCFAGREAKTWWQMVVSSNTDLELC